MTAPVIPQTPEELAEAIADRKIVNDILNNEDKTLWPKFLTAYADKFGKFDTDFDRKVNEQVEKTLASFARENQLDIRRPDLRPATAADFKNSRQVGTAYMPGGKGPGAELNGKFSGLMEIVNVVTGDPRDPEISEKRKLLKNAMSTTDPSLGGFLVPEEFRTELLKIALEKAIVRPRARVIPMTTLRVSIPMVDTTSNASSVYGGIIGYWTEEGQSLTQSQPRFGRVSLEAKKLTAYTEVPNELREDSNPSAEAFLRQSFPEAIMFFEDDAFLNGSGVGQPLGVLSSGNTALLNVAKESGQAADTILWDNIINMYCRMLPASLNSAVWIVSPNTLPQLMQTAFTVGTGGAPIGMANFNGTEGPTLSLLGRPVIISEKVPALGNANDINFIDFGQYLIGDRMALSASLSDDYKFANDVTAFRFIERVDGRPWMKSAITPKNGGDTLSAYVGLAERA